MAWHTGTGMGWWMVFGGLLWFIFWGTVIYLAVSLFRDRGTSIEQHADPLDIVKRRYARGEIGHDEYERLRRDLAA